ncbi:MAG: PadR family transcriptional regulator [Clostridium sp.]|uniref:PadR family transcriptional regulator n=1 Tax=Clostridium sp. TaxID=1506 RepID=UPI0030470C56
MPYSGGPMTEAMYYVLLAIMNPNHGYGLMNTISEVSKGRVNMGPGTLYGVLARMQKDGLIILLDDDSRRKTYKITEDGKNALLQEYNRLLSLVEDGNILKGGI